MSRSKKKGLTILKDCIQGKATGWKEKLLSKGEINSIITNFWWGHLNEERKLHWVNWQQGGNAVQRFGELQFSPLSQAMLETYYYKTRIFAWSVIEREILPILFHHASSTKLILILGWQMILWGRRIIDKDFRWHIGNSESILCKVDNWISKSFPHAVSLKEDHNPSIIWVS
ncbi:uncharacterized mitochondrial protein AtMg00310-like [Hevea brasiliensis]|uniref:uncharacterized mitochondrial protein AtMg00310-like n=1 Tax=Hevea brasiliensis TaxID=3981 RepID=UPI0025ED412D|nr:uncharacterized mitochondrial protein AtMg00310-like [Hevea brasiliensis]